MNEWNVMMSEWVHTWIPVQLGWTLHREVTTFKIKNDLLESSLQKENL